MKHIRIAALAGALAGTALLSVAAASASPLATFGSVTALTAATAELSGVIRAQGNNKVIRAQGNNNKGGANAGGGGGNRVGGGGGGGNRVGGGGGGGNRVGGGGRGGNRVGGGGGGNRFGGRGGGRGGGFNPGAAAAVGIIGGVVGIMAVDAQRKAAIRECRETYGRAYDRATGMVFLRGEQFPCP